MKKLVGYILAVAGLVIMVTGIGVIELQWKFLEGLKPSYVTFLSIALIFAGVVAVLIDKNAPKKKGKRKHKEEQAEEEVPIYEGEGKDRKIVGYRRA